eukprot:gene3224-biopygen11672
MLDSFAQLAAERDQYEDARLPSLQGPLIPGDAVLDAMPYSDLVMLAVQCGLHVPALHDAASVGPVPKGPRGGRVVTATGPRRDRDGAATGPRRGRDVAATRPRRGRDVAATWPRLAKIHKIPMDFFVFLWIPMWKASLR